MKKIYEMVKEIKEAPEILGKLLREKAKINNKIQQEENPKTLKSLHNKLIELDKEIEEIRIRQQSNTTVVNLVTALLNAGKTDDARVLLGKENMNIVVLKVLEVRKGKSSGTVRAWCEKEDGTNVVVYAKDKEAKTLTSAVGNQIEVSYKKLDKGLFAVKVSIKKLENESKKQKKELIRTLYFN